LNLNLLPIAFALYEERSGALTLPAAQPREINDGDAEVLDAQ